MEAAAQDEVGSVGFDFPILHQPAVAVKSRSSQRAREWGTPALFCHKRRVMSITMEWTLFAAT
jgi:hypothetical protein